MSGDNSAVYPKRFGLFYDFRNPLTWRKPWHEQYRAFIDQIAWIDSERSFDSVSVSEHHFVPDGWTPSPLALCAAIAARTQRVDILTNILQLPLHHPLRVAEDALTVDILSGGRFRLGVSAGYRTQEFSGLGVSMGERGSRMDESLDILRKAFAGVPFRHSGIHWSFPELTVTPGPIRPTGPEIWIGGNAPVALRRAASRGDGFLASGLEDVARYLEIRRELGIVDAIPKTIRTSRMVVTEDPDRTLHELGEHLLYQVNQYIDYGFIKRDHYTDPRDLLRDGVSEVVDVEGALEKLRLAGEMGVHELHLFAVVPGESVESGSVRLEYIAHHLLPKLRS